MENEPNPGAEGAVVVTTGPLPRMRELERVLRGLSLQVDVVGAPGGAKA